MAFCTTIASTRLRAYTRWPYCTIARYVPSSLPSLVIPGGEAQGRIHLARGWCHKVVLTLIRRCYSHIRAPDRPHGGGVLRRRCAQPSAPVERDTPVPFPSPAQGRPCSCLARRRTVSHVGPVHPSLHSVQVGATLYWNRRLREPAFTQANAIDRLLSTSMFSQPAHPGWRRCFDRRGRARGTFQPSAGLNLTAGLGSPCPSIQASALLLDTEGNVYPCLGTQ